MKILHVSFHKGCIGDINNVARLLSLDISVMKADWDYLITHDRAAAIWDKYKEYFNTFDIILTSDTAPLSRIFLQNNYSGKLIIWICNRFDYPNRDGFPDSEYFSLWNNNLNSQLPPARGRWLESAIARPLRIAMPGDSYGALTGPCSTDFSVVERM